MNLVPASEMNVSILKIGDSEELTIGMILSITFEENKSLTVG